MSCLPAGIQSCTSRDDDANPTSSAADDDDDKKVDSRPASPCSTPRAGRSRSATPLVLEGAGRSLSTSTPLPGRRPPQLDLPGDASQSAAIRYLLLLVPVRKHQAATLSYEYRFRAKAEIRQFGFKVAQ